MRLLLLPTLLFGFIFLTQGQQVKPMRSTLGAAGGSFHGTNSKIYIHQSVGQSSVIGTFARNHRTVRQGFIQPLSLQKVETNLSNELKLVAFPNPTSGKITIHFEEETDKPGEILVYDLKGQLRYSETTEISNNHECDIKELQPGIYFMEILKDGKRARLKILKN